SNSSFGAMMVGLVAGLGIAAGIWYVTQPRSPLATTTNAASAPATTVDAPANTVAPIELEATGEGFDFYDMLPAQEVVVRDDFAAQRQPRERQPAPTEPLTEPGAYLIQAGSFGRFEDADRMKAMLAILGMQARIERVEINARALHRVRIGPVSDLTQLERYRRQLREEGIDTMVIRVGQ
ncbi:MAG: SPOR domain-containing protein, partial [Pseudomonadota bacterium]